MCSISQEPGRYWENAQWGLAGRKHWGSVLLRDDAERLEHRRLCEKARETFFLFLISAAFSCPVVPEKSGWQSSQPFPLRAWHIFIFQTCQIVVPRLRSVILKIHLKIQGRHVEARCSAVVYKNNQQIVTSDFLSYEKTSRLVKSFVKSRPCEMRIHLRIRALSIFFGQGGHRPCKSESSRMPMLSLVKNRD